MLKTNMIRRVLRGAAGQEVNAEVRPWIRISEERPERVGTYELLILTKDGPVPKQGTYSTVLGKFLNDRRMVCDRDVIAWRRAKRCPLQDEAPEIRNRTFKTSARSQSSVGRMP